MRGLEGSNPPPPASPVFQDPFIEPERRRHVDPVARSVKKRNAALVLNQEKLAEWRPAMQRAAAALIGRHRRLI